ncbi:unnamed protein product [Dovyalis caffra]|uniref:Uncharacterized protein n=1 Tax=Dovyalis caffra TaxID=77055 RepID=A0AAV1SEQ8_9ROSI|nr:unnamed protein product [Dovyalis caffra]
MVHNTSTVPAGGYSQNKRPYPPPAPPLPPPPKRNSFYDHFNKRSIQDPNKNWNSQPYSAESQIPPNRAATPKPNPGIFSPSRPCTPITEGKSESRKRVTHSRLIA